MAGVGCVTVRAVGVGAVVLVAVAGLGGGARVCHGSGGGCLGSVAVRPAVPARRLPCRPVVLWNGCPCCPVGVPVSVAAFGRGVFPCGGSASARWRSVAVGSVVLVLVSG